MFSHHYSYVKQGSAIRFRLKWQWGVLYLECISKLSLLDAANMQVIIIDLVALGLLIRWRKVSEIKVHKKEIFHNKLLMLNAPLEIRVSVYTLNARFVILLLNYSDNQQLDKNFMWYTFILVYLLLKSINFLVFHSKQLIVVKLKNK